MWGSYLWTLKNIFHSLLLFAGWVLKKLLRILRPWGCWAHKLNILSVPMSLYSLLFFNVWLFFLRILILFLVGNNWIFRTIFKDVKIQARVIFLMRRLHLRFRSLNIIYWSFFFSKNSVCIVNVIKVLVIMGLICLLFH